MSLPQEIIRRKRDGQTLAPEEIAEFIRGLTEDRISEGQAAAFAMAVYFRGMSRDETVALTLAMRDSGSVLEWKSLGLDGPVVDKHSTGGVGDNVSLMLAPMLAACGCYVPMISGRGLGHTGGTLDKLGAIPGYSVQPEPGRFRETIKRAGCAIIGQTADLAPADRRLYAIRDVTATVESLPLITASILSKKLAEGLDALVLDVKVGSGAFMATALEAHALAESLVSVANGAGVRTTALITNMDEPLASAAGNALEVLHAIAYLKGQHREPELHAVTLALGAELLTLAGIAGGEAALLRALDSGAAAERFQRMVAELGGPTDLLARPVKYLDPAPIVRPVFAEHGRSVTTIDTRALGIAVIELGGGRRQTSDAIDHAVGLTDLARGGGDAKAPLAIVHARDEATFARAAALVRSAYRTGEAAPAKVHPVLSRIAA